MSQNVDATIGSRSILHRRRWRVVIVIGFLSTVATAALMSLRARAPCLQQHEQIKDIN